MNNTKHIQQATPLTTGSTITRPPALPVAIILNEKKMKTRLLRRTFFIHYNPHFGQSVNNKKQRDDP